MTSLFRVQRQDKFAAVGVMERFAESVMLFDAAVEGLFVTPSGISHQAGASATSVAPPLNRATHRIELGDAAKFKLAEVSACVPVRCVTHLC